MLALNAVKANWAADDAHQSSICYRELRPTWNGTAYKDIRWEVETVKFKQLS